MLNTQKETVSFAFESSLFSVTPSTGVLEPKQKVTISLQYFP
jgi:hypothetical protein